MNVFDCRGLDMHEKVRAGLDSLGLTTTAVWASTSSTPEVPEIVVDLLSSFDDAYAILVAYAAGRDGVLLHCHNYLPRNAYAEAQFNFPGAKSLVLIHATGRSLCVVRHHGRPFGRAAR
jgi:hypothetical protein